MKASSSPGRVFSWRSLSRELFRAKPEILSKRFLETAPKTCVAPASFFIKHASEGIPFWVPVVQGKGKMLAFILTWNKEGRDKEKVILAGPDHDSHPFRDKTQALEQFFSEWLGLPGTWSLIASEPTKTAISQDSWRLPLYYAARAAALGLHTRLDLALSGDMEQGDLSLLGIGGIPEKLAAAHEELGLSGLAVPRGKWGPTSQLFPLEDTASVDACYEGYFGPVFPPGEDMRTRGQRESDWRVSRLLSSRVKQEMAPGKLPLPAVGLVGPILPWLRGSITVLSQSDSRETAPCPSDWDQAVVDVARIAEDVASKGKAVQVNLHPACGSLFFESYFHLRKEWGAKREVIYMESPEDLRCTAGSAIPVTFNGYLPPGPGICFQLLGSHPEKELKGNNRQLTFSPAETVSDPLPTDDWGRRVLVERAELIRQWLWGTYPPPIKGPVIERDWLKKDVREWLSAPEAPSVLLLEADPGWGKTTFAASLAESEDQISARFFCDSLNKDAGVFARSVVAQLSRWFAEVEKAIQDHERIEGCRAPSDYISQLVVRPLDGTTSRPVVLVDSIHEAPQVEALVKELLSGAPTPLRFVVTSWPNNALRTSLPKEQIASLPLSRKSDENQKDLLDYILLRLRENDIPKIPGTTQEKATILAGKADGLFAYAAFALDWLAKAKGRIGLEELPSGMNGLYAKWFDKQSWVKSNWEPPGGQPGLRDLFGLLCVAETRPTKAHLQAWLGENVTELDRWLVESSAFVREVDGTYELFHRTARTWLMESYEKNPYCVDKLKAHRRIAEAGLRFGSSARKRSSGWADHFVALRDCKVGSGENPILDYYLGHLPSHLIQSGQEENFRAAETLLTNFDFQMLRCGTNGEGTYSTITDLDRLLGQKDIEIVLGNKKVEALRIWRSFFRENAHILRRGEPRWPAYKILLQLAVEHADDSPVTSSAQQSLDNGHCDWPYFRKATRPSTVVSTPRMWTIELEQDFGEDEHCLPLPNQNRVITWLNNSIRWWELSSGQLVSDRADHSETVRGVIPLKHRNLLLSWSDDRTLRLWNATTGLPLEGFILCQNSEVRGALELSDGRILSWSDIGPLCVWDISTSTPSKKVYLKDYLEKRVDCVRGVKELVSGDMLVWGHGFLCKINMQSGTVLADISVEENAVDRFRTCSESPDDVMELEGGLILWWSDLGEELTFWDFEWSQGNGSLADALRVLSGDDDQIPAFGRGQPWRLRGHSIGSKRVIRLGNGDYLSWSPDGTVLRWDAKFSNPPIPLKKLSRNNSGPRRLSSGRIVSWQGNDVVLHDSKTGEAVHVLSGHGSEVHGVDELPDGRLFSWAAEGDIRIWNQVGEPSKEGPGRQWESKVIGNHAGWVSHVWPVGQDRLLSLGYFDETMVMWEASPEAQVPMDRSEFVFKMKNGGIIVGEEDGQLTIRTGEYGEHSQSLSGHTDGVSGALELSDGRLLTWSRDCTLRLWDLTRGKQARLLTGHRRPVTGALELRDGNILSWSEDRSLRIWNAHQNRQPEELLGHEGPVDGALELSDGKIFSWANLMPLAEGWSKAGTAPIVWKPSSRQPFMRLPEDMEIREAFALDSGRVLIEPEDGPYTILRTDSQYSERVGLERFTQFVALSKTHLFYRSVDGALIEWNLATDDYPMRHFHGHCSSLHGASALDKKHLLTWGYEGLVQLWDYSRKRLLATWNVATLTSEDNIGWPYYSVSDAEIPLQWLAVPRVTRDGSTIGEEERHCDLLQVRGALRLVSRWCHNDFLQVVASSEKGYLVIQTRDGVFWVHLYRGNRRVTVQEVIQ